MGYLPTVFILGAGASRHAGAPLMKDFLAEAMRVMDGLAGKNHDLYETFDNVFVYIAKNDSLEKLLACNFQNIEDLFGLLDLEARVIPASRATRDNLLRLILETLARTIKAEVPQRLEIACDNPSDVAHLQSTPLQMLVNVAADRCNEHPPNIRPANTIISLNYDTLVEQAMLATGMLQVDYGTLELSDHFTTDRRARLRLLKLHGSMNWRTCRSCGKVADVGINAPITESLECCGLTMTALIVPPSWDKSVHTRRSNASGKKHTTPCDMLNTGYLSGPLFRY